MRLDKWLWCARFYKTRALAATAIKAHKINVNNAAIKAAKHIKIGDKIAVRKTPYEYRITILKLAPGRLSAAQAVLLFAEDKDSIEARATLKAQIKADATFPKTIGRPTKRNRREIIRFTRIPRDE